MIFLFERTYVTSMLGDYPRDKDSDELAVIHASKHPCHQEAVGYTGNLDKHHPHYLFLERGNDLYLNMINPPQPLFPRELFEVSMEFADRHWRAGRRILFLCNRGRSRAPSLALLFGAKVRHELPDQSYQAARQAFDMCYEFYAPGNGIATFLSDNWSAFDFSFDI